MSVRRIATAVLLLCAFVASPSAIAAAPNSESADSAGSAGSADSSTTEPRQRIVSLNPSLTAILLVLDARDLLVGVDEFSAQALPEVEHLPRVGGLFNPSLEAVVALEPDRVIAVPSVEQRDFRERLESMGIAVSLFENISFEQVMQNIEQVGALANREARAKQRVAETRAAWRRAAELAKAAPSPKTILIVQRDPLYVIGKGGFIDEMLTAVGGVNPAAAFGVPYPRVSLEWMLAAGPDVIVDMAPDVEDAAAYWARWSALPAVANHRVVSLPPGVISLPGPELDRSVAVLARAVQGDTFADALTRGPGAEEPTTEPAEPAESSPSAPRARSAVEPAS